MTNDTGFAGSFLRYAALDIAYHMSNLALSWALYPQYRAHSGVHPLTEYKGWVGKGLRMRARRRQRMHATAQIASHKGPLFLYPLQLSQDFQLKRYGTGEPQEQTVLQIISSFLTHAPDDAALIVKLHPLDNGLTDWQRVITRAVGTDHDRVIFLDGGDLNKLLTRIPGVVTVNSTVGLSALQAGCATHVLGKAIYDLPGLTDPGPLSRFWQKPRGPDRNEVARFAGWLRRQFHVPGTFDGPGAKTGASRIALWLANPRCAQPKDSQ